MPVPQPPINFDHKARDTTDRHGQKVRRIVIHATAGSDSLSWLSGNVDGTSIHVLIRKDGVSFKMVDESIGANHVGFSKMTIDGVFYSQHNAINCNQITLGIELENWNNGKDPYPVAQLRAAAWWVQEWLKEHGLGRVDVIMHRDIDTNGKTDARGILVTDILHYLDDVPPPPSDNTHQPSDSIIAGATGSVQQMASYLTKRGTNPSYIPSDHILIAGYYWTYARVAGIDPCMAFAQMIHETGGLTSWWCLRPRRNPAGIGVTGRTSRDRTAPVAGAWQQDLSSKLWKEGYAFDDWEKSTKAHIGHLIGYAVAPGAQSSAQRALVLCDPRAGALSISTRGSARTWDNLEGKWAVPGNTYADSIVALANAILKG